MFSKYVMFQEKMMTPTMNDKFYRLLFINYGFAIQKKHDTSFIVQTSFF